MKHIHTFESFLNEGKSQEYIVFMPIKKDNNIDIEDPTFGVYSDAEYDKYCKQYIELNKMLGKEIELRACSFFRVEYTNTGNFNNTI